MRLLDGINDTEDELYTFDSIIETEVKDTSLEALEKLLDDIEQFANSGGCHYINKRNIDIIEKDLEDYKLLKQEHEQLFKDYQDLGNLAYKDKQVLEIIKKHFVDLDLIRCGKNYEEYNSHYETEIYFLTETEFNLIKEWLER